MRSRFVVVAASSALAASSAFAVDLTVSSVEVNQSINTNGSLTLVAQNTTMIRVKVGVSGSAGAVPGVDAELHVFADGIEIPGSPFFSTNGPITAPLSPQTANINDTINFHCLPPLSGDVDFYVTVNPNHVVAETDYDNNDGSLEDKAFVCRKMVELAYVSIDYTPNGMGEPDPSLIEAGVGDAFLRGIYKTGDWNYHRSPLGALTWNSNINGSSNSLLNTLADIRNNQIPAAGWAKPQFVYGWLPGNPYSGNGQAQGIPGDVAFGNSELSRFQRTFAHEIGHCWGLTHNNNTIGTVGLDVEEQLLDPLGLAMLKPTNKKDVMVAGLLTVDAWVWQGTFNDCINDSRSQCESSDSDGNGGAGAADAQRCLRISGTWHHSTSRLDLEPVTRLDVVEPTPDNPAGDALVSAYAANGALLGSVRFLTGTSRESCEDERPLEASPFYVTMPETLNGQSIDRIVVRDLTKRVIAAQARRSANAPTAAVLGLEPAIAGAQQNGGAMPVVDPANTLTGDIEVSWIASDADGDALTSTLLYSPDGGDAWYPIGVNVPTDPTGGENRFRFTTTNLPQSLGTAGIVKVRVSDGMNVTDGEFPMQMALSGGSPPDVHAISPNTNVTFAQHATVVLHASAWDIDEGLLPEENLSWTSDLDGPVGTGRLFATRTLSPGLHTLTVTGTDSTGLESSRTVKVTITPREVRTADLNFDGVVDGADLAMLLGNWGGDGIGDLNVDGVVDGADLAMFLGAWSA